MPRSRICSITLLLVVLCGGFILLSAAGRPAKSLTGTPAMDGIQFDARNQPGIVLVTGPAILRAGQILVLSTTRDYDGRPLEHPRRPWVIFDASRDAFLSVRSGARLVIEGQANEPITLQTEPEDPALKPIVTLARGSKTEMNHVSLINIALRIEGAGHSLSDVAVQFAGNQPAFTFAGVRGSFDHLFAHHSTWGFSFEPLQGEACDLVIRDSIIRSCAKGTDRKSPDPSTYLAGGSLRAIPPANGHKHHVTFERVDWDPLWDDLNSTHFRATGQRPRIVAMGDSISQGCCRYVNFWNYLDGNDDIEHSWPYQLQLRLPEFFVVNKGEGGYLTTQMIARLPGIIEKIQPKYCYIGGGTNDIFRTNFTPEQTVSNYRTMWLMLRRAQIVPIQLAITPQVVHPNLEPRIQKTNALLKEACKQEKVRFEDVYSLLARPSGSGLDPAYDPGDGLHPNKKGYTRMAQSLFVPPDAGPDHSLPEQTSH